MMQAWHGRSGSDVVSDFLIDPYLWVRALYENLIFEAKPKDCLRYGLYGVCSFGRHESSGPNLAAYAHVAWASLLGFCCCLVPSEPNF